MAADKNKICKVILSVFSMIISSVTTEVTKYKKLYRVPYGIIKPRYWYVAIINGSITVLIPKRPTVSKTAAIKFIKFLINSIGTVGLSS
jgi:hypothetical protein